MRKNFSEKPKKNDAADETDVLTDVLNYELTDEQTEEMTGGTYSLTVCPYCNRYIVLDATCSHLSMCPEKP